MPSRSSDGISFHRDRGREIRCSCAKIRRSKSCPANHRSALPQALQDRSDEYAVSWRRLSVRSRQACGRAPIHHTGSVFHRPRSRQLHAGAELRPIPVRETQPLFALPSRRLFISTNIGNGQHIGQSQIYDAQQSRFPTHARTRLVSDCHLRSILRFTNAHLETAERLLEPCLCGNSSC